MATAIPLPLASVGPSPHRRRAEKQNQPAPLLFTVVNPGEEAKTFLVRPPDVWGPYLTCEELQEAWDELKAAGEI